jgi:type I restriction enzyme M protein
MRDPRFRVTHGDDSDYSLITRSSDGQMLFLANMASKMSHNTTLGSRIAEVHNGSSLFTGDAGQGESNIRRWLIENDWLEAIVALPLNMFYNTGIATYIWLVANKKPEHRRGHVQLIDATEWFKPLRKNLGKKNCELSNDDIKRICDTYLRFEETPQSKIFPSRAFGYWKVVVDRPLRLHSQFTRKAIDSLRFCSGDEAIREEIYEEFGDVLFGDFDLARPALEKRLSEWAKSEENGEDEADEDPETPRPPLSERRKRRLLDPATWRRDGHLAKVAEKLHAELGAGLFEDHNVFRDRVDQALGRLNRKLSAGELKLLLRTVSWRVEPATPVIAKVHTRGKVPADPLHGRYQVVVGGKHSVVEYEPDSDLRDTEQVPLLEPGGIEAFFGREVLPHVPDAWIDPDGIKIGYEISFTRHFYKPKPLRTLEEIRADIPAVRQEAEGRRREPGKWCCTTLRTAEPASMSG